MCLEERNRQRLIRSQLYKKSSKAQRFKSSRDENNNFKMTDDRLKDCSGRLQPSIFFCGRRVPRPDGKSLKARIQFYFSALTPRWGQRGVTSLATEVVGTVRIEKRTATRAVPTFITGAVGCYHLTVHSFWCQEETPDTTRK